MMEHRRDEFIEAIKIIKRGNFYVVEVVTHEEKRIEHPKKFAMLWAASACADALEREGMMAWNRFRDRPKSKLKQGEGS